MNSRKITASFATIIYIMIALVAALLMILRHSPETSQIPKIIEGSLPNFLPTALAPAFMLLSQQKYTFTSYFKFIVITFSAMCLYEIIQVWMPHRTFDSNDIVASLVGALIALLAGRLIPFPFLLAEPQQNSNKTEQGAAANP